MTDRYTRNEDKRFTLRMDKKLYEVVKQSAADHKRSVGREIEFILDQHFKSQDKD
ncbi:Arc family DNA-binding protein [Limosilactobacillus allomucosae]|uniref:Arc family DNA-binding protein n=1 Tax=Limosilactobacillus allomucosae TaxID=3142938 RepID=A0ABV0I471_9LACO